ncbi:MAG: lactoylglutathione lyase [Arenicella sp.]|jgi:lactoylglutathione lyase
MEINLIVIRTENPKELSEFYEKLGISFEYHRHGKGFFHYSAKLGDLVFEIYPFLKGQSEADKSLRLGFGVGNLDMLIESLRTENTEIVSNPKQSEFGYFAIIKDLDGRKVELKEVE